MSKRIRLIDVDRPNEPLEVEIETATETMLRVLVPNTVVRFELRRHRNNSHFEGGLGARYFNFDPNAESKAKAAGE